MAKSGNKPKGSAIFDKVVFNRVQKKDKKIVKEVEKAIEAEVEKKVEPDPIVDELEKDVLTDDEKKLKTDLAWVLEEWGGKKKLLKLAKKDSKVALALWKLLIGLEQKEIEARLRAKVPAGGGNQPGFFFIVRGLNDEKKLGELHPQMKFLEQVIQPREEDVFDIDNEDKKDDQSISEKNKMDTD